MKKIKSFGLILGIIISFGFFTECEKKEKENITEKVILNDGAIIKTENGELFNFDLKKDVYEKNSNDKTIIEYSDDKKSYIYIFNGKHFVRKEDKIIQIEKEIYKDLNLASTGNYIAYISGKENKFEIIDLMKNKEIELKSKVRISGEFFDFTKDDSIVYYGISEDGENGVFKYNLKTNEEKLIYKIPKGYIEFLKVIDNEIILSINSIEDGKKLISINLDNMKAIVLSKEIDKIIDIQKEKNIYYFLGSTKIDGDSLYLIDSAKIERVVFDFPKEISLESKLSKNNNGEILFMGKNNIENGVGIYSYNENNDIKLIEDQEGNYNFVKFD